MARRYNKYWIGGTKGQLGFDTYALIKCNEKTTLIFFPSVYFTALYKRNHVWLTQVHWESQCILFQHSNSLWKNFITHTHTLTHSLTHKNNILWDITGGLSKKETSLKHRIEVNEHILLSSTYFTITDT